MKKQEQPRSLTLGAEEPLAARIDRVADWFLSSERNLVRVGAGEGKELRVMLCRSVLHPRAPDEVVVLPAVFREIYSAGVRDGSAFVQDRVCGALGLR